MVGGGSRRDEGSMAISNTNVFAALDSLRKKKKSDKDRGRSAKGSSSKDQAKGLEAEPEVYWAPAPLKVTSWADVDDDDDYYATAAPPQSLWGAEETNKSDVRQSHVEESESEEDVLDEGDDDVEEEHDNENEVPVHPETVVEKPSEAPSAPKETERQLSKKEKKKKELAELEALLADFGVSQKESQDKEESVGKDVANEQKEGESNSEKEKKETAPTESKNAKKKKKKDKSLKEVPPSSALTNGPGEAAETEQAEDDGAAVDVKERLKKIASMKKKKSSKEMDAAARNAAMEAAARNAKLAAAKKKEKSHYNQQPMR